MKSDKIKDAVEIISNIIVDMRAERKEGRIPFEATKLRAWKFRLDSLERAKRLLTRAG